MYPPVRSCVRVTIAGLLICGGLWMGLALVLSGCSKPEGPPVAYYGPTLAGADLGLAGVVEAPATGFVLFEKSPTTGRFPASLAVVQLIQPNPLFSTQGGIQLEPKWEVGTMKTHRAVYFNSLFDTVPDVQDVIVMDERSVRRPDIDLNEIASASQRVGAKLCLIFGHKLAEPDHTALAGILLDATSGRQVAYIQADAGPADFELPDPSLVKEDQRHRDVNWLAARKFDRQIWDCLAALINRDQTPATTQPNPWRDYDTDDAEKLLLPVYVLPNRGTGP